MDNDTSCPSLLCLYIHTRFLGGVFFFRRELVLAEEKSSYIALPPMNVSFSRSSTSAGPGCYAEGGVRVE
jgi:hypothetical protein